MSFYELGSYNALQKIGLVKNARSRVDDPYDNYQFLGNPGIAEELRLKQLEKQIENNAHLELPPESDYKQESGKSLGLAGAAAGGIAGGAIGASVPKGGWKQRLMGAGIGAGAGALGLGGLGYMGGRAIGKHDYDKDIKNQKKYIDLKQSPDEQRLHLAHNQHGYETYRRLMQEAHEQHLADMSRQRVNYNVNMDV